MGGDRSMNLMNALRQKSHERDYALFCSFLDPNPNAKLLDVGCGGGLRTRQFAKSVGTSDITGMDIKDKSVPFKFIKGNIEEGLPFKTESFDIVTSSNIIEHLSNTDLFVKEVYRILEKGGYAVIATPNLASGRIIFDLLMDRQPGDADISDFFRIRGVHGVETSIGYLHRRLFTLEGLEKLLTYYGFSIEMKVKEGYGRFFFGRILGGLYACNLIVKARKI